MFINEIAIEIDFLGSTTSFQFKYLLEKVVFTQPKLFFWLKKTMIPTVSISRYNKT